MSGLLALMPATAVLIAVLGFRLSGLAAAALSSVVAGMVAALGPFRAVGGDSALRAAADALVLTTTAGTTIAMGILFVEIARRRRAAEALALFASRLELSPARSAMLVATGLGIALEGMTGMGVSLLVTVPLLVSIAGYNGGIGLSLVGMSLMPWGAMALAGVVGAQLAALPVSVMGDWCQRLSAPVAFLLPLSCLIFLRPRRVRDVADAVVVGGVLAFVVSVVSLHVGIEVAGTAGGLAVIGLLAGVYGQKRALKLLLLPAMRPYAVLLAAMIAQKVVAAELVRRGVPTGFGTARVNFPLLTTPAIALGIAATIAGRGLFDRDLWQRCGQRAWRPVLAIAFFMLAARVLIEIGAIDALAGSISTFGPRLAIVATGALGALSGFLTGSGVSGNGLFMASAVATGRQFGATDLFAGLQNSAAAHGAMASLPVAALLIASLPDRRAGTDRTVMIYGLSLLAVYLAVVLVAALRQFAVGG